MGKKKHKVRKHQNDPGDESSDDESQLDSSGKTCAHITKGVNLSGVKKIFKAKYEPGLCQNCGSQPKNENGDTDDDATGTIWMCLQCGNRGCGRYSREQHAIQHYQTPHSDCHALAINMASWEVWCYDCDENVVPEWNKKLVECVDYLKRHAKLDSVSTSSSTAFNEPKAKTTEEGGVPVVDQKVVDKIKLLPTKSESKEGPTKTNATTLGGGSVNQKSAPQSNQTLDNLPKVKGLVNLGNTCFFNSVMQCLSQTHSLCQLLDSECVRDSTVSLSGTYVDYRDKDSGAAVEVELPSIKFSLGEGSGMTQAMSLVLKEMHSSGKNKIINPGQLLGQICKRSPQFRGAQQQDSHELLRHLLDGLKSEETKRHQAGILKYFGLPTKTNPKTVDVGMKAKVKAYGKLVQQTLVDRIFSGQLISTVLCEQCRMSSQVFEPFLDLSLPVTEEKVFRPGTAKKNASDTIMRCPSKAEDPPPSKHQEKKAKKQAKRDAKVQRNKDKQQRRRVLSTDNDINETKNEIEDDADPPENDSKANNSSVSVTSSNDKDGSAEISDADVEDNAETGSTCSLNINNGAPAPAMVSGKDLNEEWYPDEVTTNTAATADCDGPCRPRHSSPDGTSFAALMDPEELSRKIGDLRIRVDDPEGEEGDCDERRSSNTGSGWDHHHLNGVGDTECVRSDGEGAAEDETRSVGNDDEADEDDDEDREERKKHTLMLKLEWMTKSLTTLAPRYQPSSLECSVLSCLNQFTASELLTGPNKFGCENCTRLKREEDHNSSSSEEKKKNDTVYTNASKQLLIFNPPAVLTLHLKRFQQVGFSLRKVNRHVEFPITIDLAPFCSSICLGLPTLSRGQTQVLYSLFAVVEHSGRLTGGHYTAFVKVRPSAVADGILSPFLNMRPASQCDVNRLVDEMHRKLSEQDKEQNDADEGGAAATGKPAGSSAKSGGRWYYVSDGNVSDSSEASVLKCQAYLLFYERIV